jgi:beta-lactamase class A
MLQKTALERLEGRLNDLCGAQPFETGWYLKDFASGDAADRRGHVVVPSASTRKISIMMAALRAVHAGAMSLEQRVTIQAKYQNNTSGCFQHLRPGFSLMLYDLLVMMIVVSDNTCTGTIADLLGLDQINEFCRSVGMTGTTHRQGIPAPADLEGEGPADLGRVNATTPADVGLLLDLIQQGTGSEGAAARLGCTSQLCRLGVEIMSWQLLNTRLPALLPEDTRVAHKTGTALRNFHDAGIIFHDDRPSFILAAYTDGVPRVLPDGTPGRAAANGHIARLCRTCWDVLTAKATGVAR